MNFKNFKKISVLASVFLSLASLSLAEDKVEGITTTSGTTIQKDGTLRSVEGDNTIIKEFKGGFLVKLEVEDKEGDIISSKSFDKLGLLDGKVFDKRNGTIARYSHGVLDGEYSSNGREYSFVDGVANGKASTTNNGKTTLSHYSYGLPVGDSGVTLESIKRQKVDNTISRKKVVDGSHYTFTLNEGGVGYTAFSVTDYKDGKAVSNRVYNNEGFKLSETSLLKDGTTIANSYSAGVLTRSLSVDSSGNYIKTVLSTSEEGGGKKYFITNFEDGIGNGKVDILSIKDDIATLSNGYLDKGLYSGYSPYSKTFIENGLSNSLYFSSSKTYRDKKINAKNYDEIKDDLDGYTGFALSELKDPKTGKRTFIHLLEFKSGTLTRRYVYSGNLLSRIVDYKVDGGYTVTTFYPNTFNIQTIQEFNRSSKEDGTFTTYSLDGKRKVTGSFKDGKKLGRVETYDTVDGVTYLNNFYNFKEDGSYDYVSYYPSGKVMTRSQGQVVDGATLIPTGQGGFYGEDGQLKTLTNFGDSLDPNKVITIRTYDENNKVASVKKIKLN